MIKLYVYLCQNPQHNEHNNALFAVQEESILMYNDANCPICGCPHNALDKPIAIIETE